MLSSFANHPSTVGLIVEWPELIVLGRSLLRWVEPLRATGDTAVQTIPSAEAGGAMDVAQRRRHYSCCRSLCSDGSLVRGSMVDEEDRERSFALLIESSFALL